MVHRSAQPLGLAYPDIEPLFLTLCHRAEDVAAAGNIEAQLLNPCHAVGNQIGLDLLPPALRAISRGDGQDSTYMGIGTMHMSYSSNVSQHNGGSRKNCQRVVSTVLQGVYAIQLHRVREGLL